MKKQVLVLLVCVSGGYISQEVQAAANNSSSGTVRRSLRSSTIVVPVSNCPRSAKAIVRSLKRSTSEAKKSLSDGDNYDALQSAMGEISSRSSRLAILDQIEQAHVWDDFKLVYQEMKLAGEQGLQQEKLEDSGKDLVDYGSMVWEGCSSTSYHAQKYIEKEQKRADNTLAKQRILELIQHIGIASVDEELLAMMSEFEEHGPNMQDQIAQQQRDAQRAIESFKVELSWYTKEWFKGGKMCGYTVKKREDLGG